MQFRNYANVIQKETAYSVLIDMVEVFGPILTRRVLFTNYGSPY